MMENDPMPKSVTLRWRDAAHSFDSKPPSRGGTATRVRTRDAGPDGDPNERHLPEGVSPARPGAGGRIGVQNEYPTSGPTRFGAGKPFDPGEDMGSLRARNWAAQRGEAEQRDRAAWARDAARRTQAQFAALRKMNRDNARYWQHPVGPK